MPISLARSGFFVAVDAPSSDALDGRIHVAEVPLVRWNLSVRVHEPRLVNQFKLLLGEVRIHDRKCDGVEGEIPCRKPGILPLVGHGNDIRGGKMGPSVVASTLDRAAISGIPVVNVVDVVLLGPEHASKRLAHYGRLIRSGLLWNHSGVERVGVVLAPLDDFFKSLAVEFRVV